MRVFAALLFIGAAAIPCAAQEAAGRPDRAIPFVLQQRNDALNNLALCLGEAQGAQTQLAAANSKIEELTKELAAAKGPPKEQR